MYKPTRVAGRESRRRRSEGKVALVTGASKEKALGHKAIATELPGDPVAPARRRGFKDQANA